MDSVLSLEPALTSTVAWVPSALSMSNDRVAVSPIFKVTGSLKFMVTAIPSPITAN